MPSFILSHIKRLSSSFKLTESASALLTYLLPPQYQKVFFWLKKVISSSATYPLVVIRTVLHDHKHEHNGFSVDKKLSFLDVYHHIRKKNGWKGFYSGLKPDLMRLIPSNAILFICYEYTKKFWHNNFSDEQK